MGRSDRSNMQILLRKLWMWSEAKRAALKRESNTCQGCHIKASVAKGKEFKVQVHHENGIDWDKIWEVVKEKLLCDPSHLKVLCKECHDLEE